jgi:hypothetical protein
MAPTKPTMATTNAAVTNWDSKHKSAEDVGSLDEALFRSPISTGPHLEVYEKERVISGVILSLNGIAVFGGLTVSNI